MIFIFFSFSSVFQSSLGKCVITVKYHETFILFKIVYTVYQCRDDITEHRFSLLSSTIVIYWQHYVNFLHKNEVSHTQYVIFIVGKKENKSCLPFAKIFNDYISKVKPSV